MTAAGGFAPLVPSKLTNVLRVCAGELIVAVVENTTMIQTILDNMNFAERGALGARMSSLRRISLESDWD
jgi:hypothetical protein